MKQHLIIGIILTVLSLAACNEENLIVAEGGIDGTGNGSNIGPITDFGSIIVNGITYETDQAEILINGEIAGFEALSLGMQVTVDSTQEEGRDSAKQISYQDSLRGPVTFISPSGNSLRMAQQTVRLHEKTLFRGFKAVDELQIGDYLRISGPSSGTKGIQATLIERLPAVPEILITGMITGLDAADQTFFINNNGFLITYQNAEILPDDLHQGQLVEIIGTSSAKGILQAIRVRLLDINTLAAGTFFIFNGTVTRFAGVNDFEVEYRPVSFGANTRINQGKLEDLALGSHVKIEGVVNEEGILILNTLNINLPSKEPIFLPMRVSGLLDNLDLQAEQLTVFGVSVGLGPNTVYRDISGQFEAFGPADLRLGEKLTVAGFRHPSGGIAAEVIHYEPFVLAQHSQLQGTATDIDRLNGSLRLFGVTVLTNEKTSFFDTLDEPVNIPAPGLALIPPADTATDRVSFFDRLNANVLVYAFGDVQGNRLLANRLVLLKR
jgi:hypothetical protein